MCVLDGLIIDRDIEYALLLYLSEDLDGIPVTGERIARIMGEKRPSMTGPEAAKRLKVVLRVLGKSSEKAQQ